MQATVVSMLLISASLAQYGSPQRYYGHGQARKDEIEQQQTAFKQWWGDELVMKLSALPTEGKVPDYRVPYSGHDYPDLSGGTLNAMFKYDQAFHRYQPLATQYERGDVSAHRNSRSSDRDSGRYSVGLFGRIRANNSRSRGVPTWYGHCNGWTAAAIRHAEPQRSVVRNGVTFTPADIKGLLAEIYMYADSEFLGGVDPSINPGILHLTLANWLGRGEHPVGMETAVGEVVINFPVFNYKSTVRPISSRESEVKTTITYTLNINREMDKGPPKYHRQMYFHYVLDLDEEGSIRGGRFFGDSQQIDMLWTPLKPAQGGEEGNRRGNPHLSVKEVLAIWRESVSEDLRNKWLNIDPTDEDRILPPSTAIVTTDTQPVEPKPTEKPAETPAADSATSASVASTATPSAATTPAAVATESSPASETTPAAGTPTPDPAPTP
jgi:hypothetical protein